MAERRGSPRIELSVDCTLRRRSGSAIAGRTVEVGVGGMSVSTARPLATDEVLHFDLPLAPGDVVDGEARVLREVGYGIYALRFEHLHGPVRERLAAVAP
jgi:PilZ domain